MDVLKNKSYRKYDRLSRYSPFAYYYNSLDDKYIYGTTSQLSQNTQYSYYVVKQNDTYDLIALKSYNNPVYYWLICDFNRISDPFEDPIPGTKLKIPVISTIEYEVS